MALSVPPAVWMHKTRSQHTKETGFLSLIKGGTASWNRKWVWIEKEELWYGSNSTTKEKSIPFSSISSVGPAAVKRLKNEGAPDIFLNFGWEIKQDDKVITFVCESLELRDVYVAYLSQFCQRHRAATILNAASPAAPSTPNFASEPTTSSAQLSEPSSANMSIAALAAAAQAKQEQKLQEQQAKAQAAPTARPARGGDDDEDSGMVGTKTARELSRLMGGGGDDDDIDEDLDDVEMSDDDEEDDDEDDSDNERGDSGAPMPKIESTRTVYERFLSPIAATPYLYLAAKHDAFKDELAKNGESVSDIVFSRYVAKVAKKDNIHDRDLVLTRQNMYLFVKGTFGGYSARTIALDQVVGILESTLDPVLFAILIPSFHDVLLRVTLLGKPGEPSEVDVKKQIIAHIFVGALASASEKGRDFLFRQADNVRDLIRRTEEDDHQPLECAPGDRLQTALNPQLYPTFRVNAESKVFFSCYCERINAQMTSSPRIFCVTDGGAYLCTAEGSRVSKRCSLNELAQLKYDSDMMGILLQFVEMDILLTIRTQSDFDTIIDLVPKIAAARQHRSVAAIASKSLKSGARLSDAKKLTDHLGKAGATTEEGMKKSILKTRKFLMRSIRTAGRFGDTMKSFGKESMDVLKSGVVGVGGAFLDNAVAGEIFGAANLLMRHERVFHEAILTMRDEQHALKVPQGDNDTLKLNGASSMVNAKVAAVWYSARCKLYNVAAHVDRSKTSDLVVTLTDKGVYLFEDPSVGDAGLLSSALQMIRSDKGYNVSDKLKWPVLRGVVRCGSEPNVVGLITSEERSTDVMFRISNAKLAEKFCALFIAKYAEAQSSPYCPVLPLVYSCESVDAMKSALKKTTFDPQPTIALRRHKFSDMNNIAGVAEIVDAIRRHGDNKVFFSGVAWRFRSSQVKKGAEKMERVLDHTSHSADNKKSFKSFILVLTNCALYFISKGALEFVRRTEVREIRKVITSTEDPDALLLKVPREYDIFMRIEGRSKEFVERLQDSVAEWTDYSLYLPGEGKGSHEIRQYTFPVEQVPSLVSIGQLEKPNNFNEMQARRSAADVKKMYYAWFDADLTRSMALPSDATVTTWAAEKLIHDTRVAKMRHSLERAFNFGLRPSTCPPMIKINKLLSEYERRDQIMRQLTTALETDDVDMYDSALEDSQNLTVSLEKLIDEQIPAYVELKKKAKVLRRIQALASAKGESTDLEAALPELDKLFADATVMNVSQTRLSALRAEVSEALQRARMQAVIRATRNPNRFDVSSREVILAAAEKLNVPATLRASIIETQDPMVTWAIRLLDQSVSSGSAKRIREAIAVVKGLDRKVLDAVRAGPLATAEAELEELIKNEKLVSDIEAKCAELRNSLSTTDALQLASAVMHMKALEAKLPNAKSLDKTRSLVTLYIERIEERLSIAESKEARRAAEQKAAAEYRARIKAREEEQEKVREAQRMEQEMENRQRRAKIVHEWNVEAEKLLFTIKTHVSNEDSGAVNSTMNTCLNVMTNIVEFARSFTSEVPAPAVTPMSPASPHPSSPAPPAQSNVQAEEILSSRGPSGLAFASLSLDELQSLIPAVENVIGVLRTARQLGTLYLHKLKESQTKTVDPALLEAIRNLDKLRVMQFLSTYQGRGLTIETVAEIRAEWQKAEQAHRWAKSLHGKIHQAVALKNLPLLEAQLELARSKGHTDAVVASAKEWLDAQKANIAADAANEGTETAESSPAKGATPAAPPAPIKPVIYELMHGWPPREPKTAVVKHCHEVTKAQISHPSNVRGTAFPDAIRLHCHDDPNRPEFKALLDAWHAVLAHRIKPAGFFRKTERSLTDVVAYVAALERKGEIVAPFSNHLAGEFERVKKLNHLHGASAAVLLIKFLLQKGDLVRYLDDLFLCTPKEMEDIFFEDSVFRNPTEAERKDLRLMAKMMTQVEWPFRLEDRADATLTRTGVDETELLSADKDQRTVPKAIGSLRRSIARLSSHFSKELARLGTRPDEKAVVAVFDENADRRIGLLVRESLSAALSSLLLVGFRTSHLLVKRHLWDLIKAAADRLRQSARGIGGVGMPDAVDMIENLTQPDSMSRKGAGAALANRSDQQLNDIRVRMFYAHALNQQMLSVFLLDAIFEDSESNTAFLDKYYHLEKAVLVLPESREEVAKVLNKLSGIPFVLAVDAELW